VILLHSFNIGGVVNNTSGIGFALAWWINLLAYSAVDIFAVVTGFCSYSDTAKPIKFTRCVTLWVEFVFYSIIVLIIAMVLFPSLVDTFVIFNTFFPVGSHASWYLNAYIDGLPVSWTIGVSPDADLVNTMLDKAIGMLHENEHPIVHSDRGAHYRWPGWIERMENAGLTRSMSKKGCSPDNSACEGFFGRLKNEMFYGRSWKDVTIEEFVRALDEYIHWYAEKRIKLSLGGMSPIQYRQSLGLLAA
jgi:hypothetical protein